MPRAHYLNVPRERFSSRVLTRISTPVGDARPCAEALKRGLHWVVGKRLIFIAAENLWRLKTTE